MRHRRRPVGPAITSDEADGGGGAIVSWEDYRGGGADVYAQRVTALGSLGVTSPAPTIAGARDIPNDQGGDQPGRSSSTCDSPRHGGGRRAHV